MFVFPFFHPYVSFFFFSLGFCPPHTYTHISPSSPFLPVLSIWFQNLPLSFFLQLSHFLLFIFLFLLDSITFSCSLCDMSHIILLAFWCHYLQTHTDTHGEKGEISFAPLHRHRCSSSLWSACNQGSYWLLFFFLIFYCCSKCFFFFFLFCSWSAVVVVLILDLLFKLNQFYESKNCFVRRNKERECKTQKQIKEERERSDKMLSAKIF